MPCVAAIDLQYCSLHSVHTTFQMPVCPILSLTHRMAYSYVQLGPVLVTLQALSDLVA